MVANIPYDLFFPEVGHAFTDLHLVASGCLHRPNKSKVQPLPFQSMRVHQRSSLAYALHVPLLWWNHPSPGWSWKLRMEGLMSQSKIGDEASVKHVPWTPKHHQTPTLAPQLVLSPSLSSWLQFLADLLWHSLSWNPFFPCCPSLHHQKPWCIFKSTRKKYYSKKPLKLMKSSTLNPFATKELVECCQC